MRWPCFAPNKADAGKPPKKDDFVENWIKQVVKLSGKCHQLFSLSIFSLKRSNGDSPPTEEGKFHRGDLKLISQHRTTAGFSADRNNGIVHYDVFSAKINIHRRCLGRPSSVFPFYMAATWGKWFMKNYICGAHNAHPHNSLKLIRMAGVSFREQKFSCSSECLGRPNFILMEIDAM